MEYLSNLGIPISYQMAGKLNIKTVILWNWKDYLAGKTLALHMVKSSMIIGTHV